MKSKVLFILIFFSGVYFVFPQNKVPRIPEWVAKVPHSGNGKYFVGVGNGETEENSFQNAYKEAILSAIRYYFQVEYNYVIVVKEKKNVNIETSSQITILNDTSEKFSAYLEKVLKKKISGIKPEKIAFAKHKSNLYTCFLLIFVSNNSIKNLKKNLKGMLGDIPSNTDPNREEKLLENLMQSIKANRLDKVAYYVEVEGANLDRQSKTWNIRLDYTFPLHFACYLGRKEIVRYLISIGADINQIDNCGYAPLHYACLRNHYNTAKVLLENDAEPDIRTTYRCFDWQRNSTPLMMAIGNFRLIKLLVEHGADINAQNDDGYAIIYWAIESGDSKKVKYLLDHGARTNFYRSPNWWQETCNPLVFAVYKGYFRIVKMLVEEGNADVNIFKHASIFKSRLNPLYIAIARDHYRIADYLLKNGAEITEDVRKIANTRGPDFVNLLKNYEKNQK